MTVLTVAIMLTAFVFPRTLVDGQEKAAREAPNDRVIVLPKQGFTVPMPARYGDEVRAMEGVKQATSIRNAGFKLPGSERFFFGSNGVDPVPFIAMHNELVAPEEQKKAFLADDRSAMVNDELARERGWKVGDRLIFESWLMPNAKWELTISCIYAAVGAEWARRNVYVHYEFLNRGMPASEQDKINLISAQIFTPNQGGRIAKAIDLHFDAAPVRTLSMEDRVLAAASLGRIGAILAALDYVSYLILFVVLAILLNTLTLNVRERTREFGVLRAIGFGPGYLYVLVLGEGGGARTAGLRARAARVVSAARGPARPVPAREPELPGDAAAAAGHAHGLRRRGDAGDARGLDSRPARRTARGARRARAGGVRPSSSKAEPRRSTCPVY